MLTTWRLFIVGRESPLPFNYVFSCKCMFKSKLNLRMIRIYLLAASLPAFFSRAFLPSSNSIR